MKYPLTSGVLGLFLLACVAAETAYDYLQRKPEFSKFYELVNKDQLAKMMLGSKSMTLFVPVNRAVEEAETRLHNFENNIASYHILLQIAEKSIFPTTVGTFLSSSAALFLTSRVSEPSGQMEYFVNNARIIDTQELRASDNSKQLIYVIDEVLEPYVSTTGSAIDALSFLGNPNVYGVKEDVGAFASRVRSEKQEPVFQQSGNHTFFISIGYGDSENINKLRQVDATVIQGHVIPNQVIFTRVMGTNAYHTMAYNEEIKVEISLQNSTNSNDGSTVLKVQSNTLQSGPSHRKGVVLSRIVRANIPVKNGVVHLIESPLMIIDISVWQFIQNEQDGRLSKFADLIHYAPDLRYELQSQHEKTVFAPNNEAIERLGNDKLKELKNNISSITTLLHLHMVKTSVSTDDVKSRRITELQSADTRKKLYFSIVGEERNRTLSVQGGGVNALAVQADIGATDGIIHIIDRVLGMPYLTVYETLKETESELNETYQVSSQDNWNMQLKNLNQKFTFFAPSNEAWRQMELNLPTPYKQIHMGTYAPYVKKILDRHLVVERALNLHDLEKEVELQTINAVVKIERSFNSDELFVSWEGIRARITRPDVQATNGIIHIIDQVMMKNRDLIKSEAALATSSLFTLILGFLLTAL